MTSKQKIFVWPDDCWCREDELESMSHKSDDFTICYYPENYSDDEIDKSVHWFNRNQLNWEYRVYRE